MPEEYTSLVSALKALTQGTAPDPVTTLPMAKNEWNTRPNADSYGIVALDMEVDALYGNNLKQITAYEGSIDLFSRSKDGAGWVELIAQTLIEYCDGAWSLNSHQYERENGIFHWEWVFQVEG